MFRFGPEATEFARYHGFAFKACAARDAKRTGKCERPFGELNSAFMQEMALAPPGSIAELNVRATKWLEAFVNPRPHRVTGEAPRVRLEAELALLGPLPRARYDTARREPRVVNAPLPLVEVDRVAYSVPPSLMAHDEVPSLWASSAGPALMGPALESTAPGPEVCTDTGGRSGLGEPTRAPRRAPRRRSSRPPPSYRPPPGRQLVSSRARAQPGWAPGPALGVRSALVASPKTANPGLEHRPAGYRSRSRRRPQFCAIILATSHTAPPTRSRDERNTYQQNRGQGGDGGFG